MKFRYSKQLNPTKPNDPFRRIPIVEVAVSFGKNSVIGYGLIDSGADYCLFNKQYADELGIDLSGAEVKDFIGIGGIQKIPAQLVEVDIETKHLSKIKIPVGFIDSPSVNILLGQVGYFDNYRIKFERDHDVFEIVPVKR